MNILMIEPNALLARQYNDYLTKHGHTVLRTADAQAAILSADKQKPDVVILELLLTSHSGIEFLYEFRSYAEWQQIPVIVLSSVQQTGLSKEAQQDLKVQVLYKPDTSLKKLEETIRRVLS